MPKLKNMLFYFLLLWAAASLILFPEESREAAQEGLQLCFSAVIPALFPFFVLSNLLIATGSIRPLTRFLSPQMHRLFSLSGAGAGAVLLGLAGGYPLGAKTAAELYARAELSREETEQLLAFCSNSGPGFFLGICAAVQKSTRAGIYLYLIHVFSALLCGILLRRSLPSSHAAHKSVPKAPLSPLRALPAAVSGAFAAVWNVCGFVVLFLVVLRLLSLLPAAARLSPLPRAALFGFVELTNGVLTLPATKQGFVLCAALTGWGGLSVHAQTLALLPPELRLRPYFLGKTLHSLLSALFAFFATLYLFP